MARREKREKDQWDRLLEQIDFHGMTQEEALGQDGLVKQLTGRILQRALECEMDLRLGCKRHDPAGDNCGDSRNGHTEKAVLTGDQEAVVQAPRGRNGTFDPQIVPKYQKRAPLFNDQIISMYSLGTTDRDIKARLEKIYNVEASPDLSSRATDGVMEEAKERQNRPLEKTYAIMRLDAIRVKAKQDGKSCAKSVSAALGVNFEGQQEVLGLWISENEGASDFSPRSGWGRSRICGAVGRKTSSLPAWMG
jgi:transposase-like protein